VVDVGGCQNRPKRHFDFLKIALRAVATSTNIHQNCSGRADRLDSGRRVSGADPISTFHEVKIVKQLFLALFPRNLQKTLTLRLFAGLFFACSEPVSPNTSSQVQQTCSPHDVPEKTEFDASLFIMYSLRG
jgi:hypothetical protein